MRMCEYANNLIDMVILFYMQDKYTEIVNDEVYNAEDLFHARLHITFYKLPNTYIVLGNKSGDIRFARINKLYSNIYIDYY